VRHSCLILIGVEPLGSVAGQSDWRTRLWHFVDEIVTCHVVAWTEAKKLGERL
jgi:hypothetical protein